MFHLLHLCIFNVLIMNAIFIDDIQSLFEKKKCIQASLLSISHPQDASIMLDKSSTTTSANISEITKPKFDKSVTSKINELAQYNEISYTYELISEEGPAHDKKYQILLKLGDEEYEGSGSSLKKAQQVAASAALDNTNYSHPPIKLENEKSLTPTVVLNNVAAKLGIGVAYFLLNGNEEQGIASYGSYNEAYGKSKHASQKWNQSSNSFSIPTEEPQVSGPFSVRVKVGESEFVGLGHTIQAARHDAATQAIKNLEKQVLNNACANEESTEECKRRKENLKSPVSRIYETAQKHNLPVEFNVISESGKSHQKTFITQCKVGDFNSEGEGNSKKESKRKAAENMLENLAQLPEIVDGKAIINVLSDKKKKKRKKKNKIVKNNNNIINDVLNAFWSVENEPTASAKPKPNSNSPKDKLLDVGNILNIEVQFMDLNKRGDEFYTLVTLGMQPEYICLGQALTREKSHEDASLHGLKLLHKFGILDTTELAKIEEETVPFEDDSLEEKDLKETFEDFDKND